MSFFKLCLQERRRLRRIRYVGERVWLKIIKNISVCNWTFDSLDKQNRKHRFLEFLFSLVDVNGEAYAAHLENFADQTISSFLQSSARFSLNGETLIRERLVIDPRRIDTSGYMIASIIYTCCCVSYADIMLLILLPPHSSMHGNYINIRALLAVALVLN